MVVPVSRVRTKSDESAFAGGRFRFACRVCHDLAYESEQTNRGFTQALFRLVTWEEGGCSMREARRILRRRYGFPMLEPELIDAASAEG